MFMKQLLQAFAKNNVRKNFAKTIYLTTINKSDNKIIQPPFENVQNKNKLTYLETIRIFTNRDNYRRGHVEFIYAALNYMKEFGVSKDLEVYKALIDVLPKGKFIPQNVIQAEFMHYSKQQQCIIDLLEQMEENGVIPDVETEDLLLNIFGKRGFPLRKYWRMMYWMPKFKNLSPWPLPASLPNDILELAVIAIKRISSVDIQSKTTIFREKNTWIVSSQSKTQRKLLNDYNNDKPVYVDGPFKVWIKHTCVNYFVLKGKPNPMKIVEKDTDDVINVPHSIMSNKESDIPSVHEQEDGIIFAVCATGTSSKNSLLSWIRHLENDGNEKLALLPVVFNLRHIVNDLGIISRKK